MTRERKYHQPLPATFDEVLKFVAKEQKPKKRKKKEKRRAQVVRF